MARLAQALAFATDRRVQERGEEYVREGRVKITAASSLQISTQVLGTSVYQVLLRVESDTLSVACSCPYADDDICKHIWAAARVVDGCGYLAAQPHPTRITLSDVDDLPGADEAYGRRPLEVEPSWVPSRDDDLHRWRRLLTGDATHPALARRSSTKDEIWYLLEQAYTDERGALSDDLVEVQPVRRKRLRDGSLGAPTPIHRFVAHQEHGLGEELVGALMRSHFDGVARLSTRLAERLLPQLCETERVAIDTETSDGLMSVSWDGGEPWRVRLDFEAAGSNGVRCRGTLVRAGQTQEVLSLERALPLSRELIIVGQRIARLAAGSAGWLDVLLEAPLTLARADLPDFLGSVASAPEGPLLGELAETGYSLLRQRPTPTVRFKPAGSRAKKLHGSLVFHYAQGLICGAESGSQGLVDRKRKRVLLRDYTAELEAARLFTLHQGSIARTLSEPDESGARAFKVSVSAEHFPELAHELLEAGFRVEAEGRRFRRASQFNLIVESGLDWFGVKGNAKYDSTKVELPSLLRAAHKEERWVRLGDGSLGLLPKDWLEQLQTLSELADPKSFVVQVGTMQALLLHAALATTPGIESDAQFEEVVARMRTFSEVKPMREPKSFSGELRDYQRQALGWLTALDRMGLSGCLADDMGLGKTVVVLAWLLRRRKGRSRGLGSRRPSLLVVPKSLLFNWQSEARRFTPELRLLMHHGADRSQPGPHFSKHDIVLTSYGTLRRDIQALQQIEFDHLVLDEAHNIKNPHTGSHRSARAIRAERRLALTGTPVENHLGELWALLVFLNPGLFERLKHVQKAFERKRPSQVALERSIRAATKPFVLRRTKAEVAKDLPERTEHVIYVEQSGEEKQRYRELAEYYRARLLQRRDLRRQLGPEKTGGVGGTGRAAAEMLEALLRLRQAACHPGLIDETLQGQRSAKVDLLVQQLLELQSSGQKALVFSQFTQLLSLVGRQLDEAGIAFASLDGKTRNREGVVKRFQEDDSCGVFLISLKAGGVGLNLTAAEYVFILDPWWNPAAEAQAIDRAHRIGQTRHVFSYRLLTRHTIEEKVDQLQQEKRELAAALFGNPQDFTGKLNQEDFEQLLG